MNEKKDALLRILKAKGDCIKEICAICPLYPGCGLNMWDDDMHYTRALELYVQEFGEVEMIEELL